MPPHPYLIFGWETLTWLMEACMLHCIPHPIILQPHPCLVFQKLKDHSDSHFSLCRISGPVGTLIKSLGCTLALWHTMEKYKIKSGCSLFCLTWDPPTLLNFSQKSTHRILECLFISWNASPIPSHTNKGNQKKQECGCCDASELFTVTCQRFLVVYNLISVLSEKRNENLLEASIQTYGKFLLVSYLSLQGRLAMKLQPEYAYSIKQLQSKGNYAAHRNQQAHLIRFGGGLQNNKWKSSLV